jgi:hypothetical protein
VPQIIFQVSNEGQKRKKMRVYPPKLILSLLSLGGLCFSTPSHESLLPESLPFKKQPIKSSIPIPAESDICTFALRTDHFRLSVETEKCLFTLDTRPRALRQLYEAAAVAAIKSLDSIRRDGDANTSMDMFMCTPILGKRRRDQSLDIEARVVSKIRP